MPRNVWNDIVSYQTRQLNNSTKYLFPASMTTTLKRKNWKLKQNCHKYALKLFWNACTWHVLEEMIFPGQRTILRDRSRNGPKLVTNAWIAWYLTFITHVNINSIVMFVIQQNNAGWDYFKTPILRDILRTQNLHQVEHFAFLEVIHLFQKVGCVRNKLQFHTVHQNPKSSLWTLDWDWTGFLLSIYGIWLFQSLETIQTPERPGRPFVSDKNQRSPGMTNVFHRIDCVPSNVQSSHQEALLFVFEDNEAVIKMIIKGRSPTMRHVFRTHRVALDWLFDRINLDSKIQIKYIDTKNQLADMLTKGHFTRDGWNHLLCLFNFSHFSFTVCSETMAKRLQQDSREERVTAKSRPMMSHIARVPSNVSSSTSVRPGKKSYGNQNPWSSKAEREEPTGEPVVGSDPKTASDYYHEQFTESSFSARYSKWNDNQVWSSQEWKTEHFDVW